MEIPEKIRFAAQRLREGRRVNRITVRDFLRHFGAERRGAVKVQAIRAILDSLDVETAPDFETAWIDGPIWLHLKEGVPITSSVPIAADGYEHASALLDDEEIVLESSPSAVQDAEEQAEGAPTSADREAEVDSDSARDAPSDDPTFRIGRLPAANKKLIVVNQDDSLQKAVTLLLHHDFSQLPVMQGDRDVKGVVTWKSIASKLALECKCDSVRDCRVSERVVDSNRTLFDCIPTIVDYGYVLVRDQRDKRITGIVTASDLSLEFQALSEPFLLLREIELHVRQLLVNKVSTTDLELLESSSYPKRKPQNIADLAFGEYVRLLQHPLIWPKLQLKIDSGVLTTLLEEVRLIRNDVMHFDPDPMTSDELHKLKNAVRLMQSLYELLT